MPRCSLSMIVKDEEETLGRVLADASAFCDELVVCDTGSTDRTREIAIEAGATVIDFAWIDDFAAARNASLDACTGDLVVWLDADDRVPPAAQAAFVQAIAQLEDGVDALITPYHRAFNDRGEVTFVVLRERVWRRSSGVRWEGAVHEVMDFTGHEVRQDDRLVVEHHKTAEQQARDVDRNLRILDNLYAGGDRTPRTLFYRANELRDHDRPADALGAYDEYLATDAPDWERYDAMLSRGRMLLALERAVDARASALQAVLLEPGRPEAWMAAGLTYYEVEDWERGAPFFAAATRCRTRPPLGFTFERDYTWAPWDYLSVCLGNSGRYREAVKAAERALPGNPEAPRVKQNLQWFRSQIKDR
ncbi:MAG TPA: glycosyltransferase family 2 protein [Mycobacteriales bacterium]|nr:glycosyltransferase family 2 protein [Mycobacteriales bacterium]